MFDELKSLLVELSRMDIAEFELEYREFRMFVRKNGNGARVAAPVLAASPLKAVASPETLAIVSPLTGIFYLRPAPTEKPFVQEGDVLEKEQVVGMVEAMKVFNEIRAEWSGRVVRILAGSGELVQSGQTLMELAPLP